MQRQSIRRVSSMWRRLGGKRNFHNGVGGTYDCIAIMSYYVCADAVTSFREMEMEENLILPVLPQAAIRGLQQAILEKADA